MIGFLVILVMISIIALLVAITVSIEENNFNYGICPKCGGAMVHFDTDSTGARGYKCKRCWYMVWVSYNCVDKDFRSEDE